VVGHFVVVLFCLRFSPTRERDREKGICGDEIGIEFLLPKEKRFAKKKVEIFKAAFSSNGVVTNF